MGQTRPKRKMGRNQPQNKMGLLSTGAGLSPAAWTGLGPAQNKYGLVTVHQHSNRVTVHMHSK
jgi:hypothetical protein